MLLIRFDVRAQVIFYVFRLVRSESLVPLVNAVPKHYRCSSSRRKKTVFNKIIWKNKGVTLIQENLLQTNKINFIVLPKDLLIAIDFLQIFINKWNSQNLCMKKSENNL